MKRVSIEELSFGGAPHRLDGWLAFLLEAAGRIGLTPIRHERLHLLLFYSAVLTPIYKLETPVPKIIKFRDAPYYPEAQVALETLAARGFVSNSGRQSIQDQGWFSDSYWLSDAGLAVVPLLRASDWGKTVSRFANDLIASFAELRPASADEIIGEDAIFREGRARKGDVVTVEGRNQAVLVADWVAAGDDGGMRPSPRDSIALYFRYLQARRAA